MIKHKCTCTQDQILRIHVKNACSIYIIKTNYYVDNYIWKKYNKNIILSFPLLVIYPLKNH